MEIKIVFGVMARRSSSRSIRPSGDDAEVGDLEAVFFQALAAIEHGFVVGYLRDDVIAAGAMKLGDALDGQIVGFGSAAGEDDLARVGADQAGDLRARVFYGFLGFPPELVVAAGGVAEFLGEIGQHGVQHARIDSRGRLIVHVDG